MQTVKNTMKKWFMSRYEVPEPEAEGILMIAGNDLVMRGHEQQLRLTFLEGEHIHGHAYFEPLTAPVQIT